MKNVNRFVNRAYSPNPVAVPLAVANAGIAWDLNNAEKISNALQRRPAAPGLHARSTCPSVQQLPPIQPGSGVIAARANALNALDDALAQANAYGTAAATAFDRPGGAAEAGDLYWASTQTGVMLEYNQLMGQSLISAAQRINDVITAAATDLITTVPITISDVILMQQNLAASGFSSQEITDAHAVGLTDADLADLKANILAANPQDLAGDVILNMQQIAAQFINLGNVLANPGVFNPGYSVAGAGPQPVGAPQAAGNTMAQVYNVTATTLLANPSLTTSETVTLSVRRIDLPADWSVEVSPSQVTLGPNTAITVTVNILAGSPLPQGSRPRVAVEGYNGSVLLGGVVIDVVVPVYQPFDGKLRQYLPAISR